MKIRLTPLARADLGEISSYLRKRSPSGARNVLRSIHSALAFIAENPLGAEKTDEPAVRVKVIVEYPYKMFYRIGVDVIDILHVRHSARAPWRGAQG